MDESARGVYEQRGLGARQGTGNRPALVVIDFNVGFTDPESSLHCDCDGALKVTAELLAAARESGAPVFYTTVSYDEAGLRTAGAFIAKVPPMAIFEEGSHWTEIDERIAPRSGEPVLKKLFTSGFFGTPLATMLTVAGCDTVIVVGASTSGCVRATAVDALQHGFRVIVPRDAVADRAVAAHEASLTDIDAKYGDVVSGAEVLAFLSRHPTEQATPA